jgi:pyruvate/2-oxoglutarate dehydrogenase complex dihydrolipoamide acyltransferase (E2) component
MSVIETLKIPQDNVNDNDVTISSIYIEKNDYIDENTHILDYETSKANFELSISKAGYVQLNCIEGDIVKIGHTIGIVSDNKDYVHQFKKKLNEEEVSEQTFSKKAEILINEMSVDKSVFKYEKFVTEDIVRNFLNDSNDIIAGSDIIKISPRKLFEIKNLTNVSRNGLVSSVEKKINSSEIDTESPYENNEFKGSLSILLIKVISELLKIEKYKHLNSSCDGENIFINNDVNFGLALNLGSGLKIGVIKKSNSLSINEIESKTIQLIDKYIDDKLQKKDIEGFSVVLTDLTEKKIDTFTPLITSSNTLMIGLAGEKGSIQKLIIAFDHRVTDGLEISSFINDVLKDLVESYRTNKI